MRAFNISCDDVGRIFYSIALNPKTKSLTDDEDKALIAAVYEHRSFTSKPQQVEVEILGNREMYTYTFALHGKQVVAEFYDNAAKAVGTHLVERVGEAAERVYQDAMDMAILHLENTNVRVRFHELQLEKGQL